MISSIIWSCSPYLFIFHDLHYPVLVIRILVHVPWNSQVISCTCYFWRSNSFSSTAYWAFPWISIPSYISRSGWSCCENQPLSTHGIFWSAFIIIWHSYAVYDFVETLTLSETMLVSYSMIGRFCVHCASIALIDSDLLTFRFHHPPRTWKLSFVASISVDTYLTLDSGIYDSLNQPTLEILHPLSSLIPSWSSVVSRCWVLCTCISFKDETIVRWVECNGLFPDDPVFFHMYELWHVIHSLYMICDDLWHNIAYNYWSVLMWHLSGVVCMIVLRHRLIWQDLSRSFDIGSRFCFFLCVHHSVRDIPVEYRDHRSWYAHPDIQYSRLDSSFRRLVPSEPLPWILLEFMEHRIHSQSFPVPFASCLVSPENSGNFRADQISDRKFSYLPLPVSCACCTVKYIINTNLIQ